MDRTAFHESLTGSPVASPELVTPKRKTQGQPRHQKGAFHVPDSLLFLSSANQLQLHYRDDRLDLSESLGAIGAQQRIER